MLHDDRDADVLFAPVAADLLESDIEIVLMYRNEDKDTYATSALYRARRARSSRWQSDVAHDGTSRATIRLLLDREDGTWFAVKRRTPL